MDSSSAAKPTVVPFTKINFNQTLTCFSTAPSIDGFGDLCIDAKERLQSAHDHKELVPAHIGYYPHFRSQRKSKQDKGKLHLLDLNDTMLIYIFSFLPITAVPESDLTNPSRSPDKPPFKSSHDLDSVADASIARAWFAPRSVCAHFYNLCMRPDSVNPVVVVPARLPNIATYLFRFVNNKTRLLDLSNRRMRSAPRELFRFDNSTDESDACLHAWCRGGLNLAPSERLQPEQRDLTNQSLGVGGIAWPYSTLTIDRFDEKDYDERSKRVVNLNERYSLCSDQLCL